MDLRVPRRTFLAVSGALAAGLWLPTVRGSPAAAEALHRRAQRTAAGARSTRPAGTIAAATDLLTLAEVAALAPGAARRSLHRTASLAAATAALAAQRAQRPSSGFITRAREHADAAGDGPLRAQALVLQRDGEGVAGHMMDAGSQASVKLLRAALHAAGSGRDTASLRAGVHYRLAWERATLGDAHGALQELEGADASVALTGSAPDYFEDADIRGGAAAAKRGKALRVARRPVEAEAALAEAMSTRLHPAGALVDIAKARAAAGDVEGAVAALEEGYLAARTAEDRRAAHHVRTVAATLPDTTATRQLRALIRD
ncbi:MAG: hypothetical protein JWM18_4253 [Chloroflexi bacterium]|nr:hypothetical protein [Chloroflexota bacterium]